MPNSFVVAVVSFADTVLRLNTEGNVTVSYNAPTFEIGSFLSTVNYTASSLNQEQVIQSKKSKARPTGPTDDERKALSMTTGDKTIYRFYFGSIGISWFLAFIITTIAGTFCSHFSRKPTPNRQVLTCLIVLEQRSGSNFGLAAVERTCRCICQSSLCLLF